MTSLPLITRISAAFPAVRMSSIVFIAVGESRISVLAYSTRFQKNRIEFWWTEHVSKCVASSQLIQYGLCLFLAPISTALLPRTQRPSSASYSAFATSLTSGQQSCGLTKGGANHDKALSWNSLMVIYTMTFLHCQYLLWYFFIQSKRKTTPIFFLYPLQVTSKLPAS